MAKIYHAHLWGDREGKYRWLWENDIISTCWNELTPSTEYYLFIPQETRLFEEYKRGLSITEIASVNVLGFQTHRDMFAIDFSRDEIYRRVTELRSQTMTDEELRNRYGLRDNRDWQLATARKQLRSRQDWEKHLIACLYRPFDKRSCYFDVTVMDYPRRELTAHVERRDNLCILVPRQIGIEGWRHILITKNVAESCVVSTKTKEQNYVFPLYLYPSGKPKSGLFDEDEATDAPGGRRPNLSEAFTADFSHRLSMAFVPDGKGDRTRTFGPEDVFAYAYAVFHSPGYRSRYAEFLKMDFPRLPLTSDPELFRALCALGDALVGLHLMERTGPALPGFRVGGDSLVENVRYAEPGQGNAQGCVWINRTQYFEGVPPEVWAFHVGGYQVCQKWLKDRKGRALSFDDLNHYRKTVAALAETIRLMTEVDAVIEGHGGWPLRG
jgi:predicted helicase